MSNPSQACGGSAQFRYHDLGSRSMYRVYPVYIFTPLQVNQVLKLLLAPESQSSRARQHPSSANRVRIPETASGIGSLSVISFVTCA